MTGTNKSSPLPFFSIITCTYNSITHIEELIDSVENQTLTDYEHIFIDAYSNDGTVEIIRKYKARSVADVTLIQSPPLGISDAMNKGIDAASGEVILHLHSDDYLACIGTLDFVKKQFDNCGKSIVIGNCKLIGQIAETHTWPISWYKKLFYKTFFLPIMFYTNPIPHPSTYIRKSVFTKYGYFDIKYKVAMDYELWFRIFRSTPPKLTDEVLSVYRFHDGTISTTQMHLGPSEIYDIRKTYRSSYMISYLLYIIILNPIFTFRRCIRRVLNA